MRFCRQRNYWGNHVRNAIALSVFSKILFRLPGYVPFLRLALAL
jgi:hypothetical protein